MVLDSPQKANSDPQAITLQLDERLREVFPDAVSDTGCDGEPSACTGESADRHGCPEAGHGVAAVAISHLGGMIVAGTFDGRVTIWQDGPHTPWVTTASDKPIVLVSLSSDETRIAASAEGGSLTLIRVADGAIIEHWPNVIPENEQTTNEHFPDRLEFLNFDEPGQRLACGFQNGWLRWLNTTTGELVPIRRVTHLGDFALILNRAGNEDYKLSRDGCDMGLILRSAKQLVAWIPGVNGKPRQILADRDYNIFVSIAEEPRFYVREGGNTTGRTE